MLVKKRFDAHFVIYRQFNKNWLPYVTLCAAINSIYYTNSSFQANAVLLIFSFRANTISRSQKWKISSGINMVCSSSET